MSAFPSGQPARSPNFFKKIRKNVKKEASDRFKKQGDGLYYETITAEPKKPDGFMAAPKNNMDKKAPAKNVAGVRSDREKLFRALLVLFILIAAATALVFGVFWARQQLFNRNDRFKSVSYTHLTLPTT